VQVFINLQDNSPLDEQGFAAFGRVVEGMDVVERLHGGYGEKPTGLQTDIARAGNEFLQLNFPNLDAIERAFVEK
jgi:cyclophilin family peptidyl-prolyl cis-trans isomerase